MARLWLYDVRSAGARRRTDPIPARRRTDLQPAVRAEHRPVVQLLFARLGWAR
jgi:hypothetical protein